MKKIVALCFVLAFVVSTSAQRKERPAPQPAPEIGESFKLGVAGYTFYKFDLETALKTLQRCDVNYLCIKDFHLPVNSSDEEIAAFNAKCAEYGVKGYAVGPLYMKSEEDIDKYFEYAKRVGVTTIVDVPEYELLSYVDQ